MLPTNRRIPDCEPLLFKSAKIDGANGVVLTFYNSPRKDFYLLVPTPLFVFRVFRVFRG